MIIVSALVLDSAQDITEFVLQLMQQYSYNELYCL